MSASDPTALAANPAQSARGVPLAASGPLPMAPSDWATLMLLSMLWGGSFFFGKVAIAEVQPLTIVLTRVSIGALALFVLARVTGVRLPLDGKLIGRFLVLAVIANIIPFGLISWSQQHMPSGLSSILNAATPLFTVIVAQAFTRDEKLTAGKLIGVLMGFGGVAIMMGPALLGQIGGHSLPAQLAAIGATISYGFATVYGRQFRHLPPMGVAMAQLTASSLLLIPLVAIFERPWELPGVSGHVIAALEANGWALVRQRGSHRQFKHPHNKHVATVAGRRSSAVPAGTLANIRRITGLKEFR